MYLSITGVLVLLLRSPVGTSRVLHGEAWSEQMWITPGPYRWSLQMHLQEADDKGELATKEKVLIQKQTRMYIWLPDQTGKELEKAESFGE